MATVQQLHHRQLVQLLTRAVPESIPNMLSKLPPVQNLPSQASMLKHAARAWWWHTFHRSASGSRHMSGSWTGAPDTTAAKKNNTLLSCPWVANWVSRVHGSVVRAAIRAAICDYGIARAVAAGA